MAMAPEQVGIGIRRHFTTEGIHPYDQVTWERRDSRIVNYRDGSVAFEQLGVEVPSTWSFNATNILAQKYFRGTLGTPEREWSLRQVVDRVVDTIAHWGHKDGYFVDRAEADAFSAELKHLVITQKAAFNSPVWFNIGVKGVPQQASACQPYHALVSTVDGLVPIGELVETDAVGTKVYDGNGVTKVVATKANGRKNVLRVHTRSGYFLDVTADHLVWRAEGVHKGEFVEAGSLRIGDQLEWHRTESWGSGEIARVALAEAALAGWLVADGRVEIASNGAEAAVEAMTVTDAELAWVSSALDVAFPDERCHQVSGSHPARVSGPRVAEFVRRWGLRDTSSTGTDGNLDSTVPPGVRVPDALFSAPAPVVAAYLRSVFQAAGYVAERRSLAGQAPSVSVALDVDSGEHARGLQSLLLRFGIFSRVRRATGRNSKGSERWRVAIRSLGDRRRFADEIGFLDPVKGSALLASFESFGAGAGDIKLLEVEAIEELGEMEVYDIQTESGEYLSNNLRVHNCFILSVDDSMRSILNWYVEEGVIFKGGSGAGINLSRIRSSEETLKGGGTASGPVSFMRGADASAGTIKSGGKTRRAAKMVILDVDHPDIEDFIWCKALEERKARVLRDAGFDMDLDGKDNYSLQYQNANNSVRVTDDFMAAVIDDADWHLRAVTDGSIIKTVRARDLMRQISQATWECADPGMQFDTTINRWNTAANTGRINGSNPCSEYMHLDNSACNLASLNLLAFLDPATDEFDVEGFRHAVEVVFTAQEILVGNADYPTESIAETSRQFRQLGIGYANLGAMLMALGLPYDSNEGRSLAAAVTALMTGHAYATSARIAGRMGPFGGYTENAEHMLRVLRMHRDAAASIDEELAPTNVLSAAQKSWDLACELGEVHGVRNSQASVLAPTGTIGLLMDCDTTGIEPDLGLCKVKKLVGGGTMSIVNQTVPRALRRLGYTLDQIEAIIEYVDVQKSILGAPHLSPEHVAVFACSMGDNTIHHMGHLRMMGAVQPFISGAISKTVNMPEEVTVEDVEQLHIDAWRLGIKAVAVYRDNCKVAQPLSTAKKDGAVPDGTGITAAPVSSDAAVAPPRVVSPSLVGSGLAAAVPNPVRARLPRNRRSRTFEFRVADCKGFVTVGEYDDGRPGEVFMKVSKQGSTLAGIMDAFAISVSHGLQYGVPLKAFVEAFINMRFEPAGMTDDPDIRFASSLVDFIFRRLAVDYLPLEERMELGILSVGERLQPPLPGMEDASVETVSGLDVLASPPSENTVSSDLAAPAAAPIATGTPRIRVSDAPYCMQCGVQMMRSGSCYACPSCGSTSGCS